jgi:site-specific recombinase XerD
LHSGGSGFESHQLHQTFKDSSLNLLISPNNSIVTESELHRLTERFLLSCKVEYKSAATVIFYKYILDHFLWYVKEYKITNIDALVIRSFLAYIQETPNRWNSLNYWANKKVTSTTIVRYYTGLAVFFNWCVKEELLDKSPMATLKKPQASKKVIKGLDNGLRSIALLGEA